MKNKPENLAERIAGDLRKNLSSAAGENTGKLPSARQLAAQYKCSHQTANSALNILTAEGLIFRKHGSGSWKSSFGRKLNIACMLDVQTHADKFSLLPDLIHNLLIELKKNICDFQIFSYSDLKKANFSPRLFDRFDGLITDTRFSDPHSRQLINEFNKPKLWPWPSEFVLASGNQLIADYVSGYSSIFQKARRHGINKRYLYYNNEFFRKVMFAALVGCGWHEEEFEFVNIDFPATILGAYKYALNIPAEADILHVCTADMIAWGFFEAMRDRNLPVGDFHITGMGNMEARGFIPLGEPKLTTVHHPREPYFAMAVKMFCRKIREQSLISEVIQIPGELVLRESAFYSKK